jgi:hypothetical protein
LIGKSSQIPILSGVSLYLCKQARQGDNNMNNANFGEPLIQQLLEKINHLDQKINGQKPARSLRSVTKLRMYLNMRAQFTNELCQHLCLREQRLRQR